MKLISYNKPNTFRELWLNPFKPPVEFDEVDESTITGIQMIKMRKDGIKKGTIKENEVLEFSSLIK